MKLHSAWLSLFAAILFLLPTGLCAANDGEYIVTVKDDVSLSEEFLEAYHLTPLTEEDHGVYLTDAFHAARLEDHRKVEAVEENATVTLCYDYNDAMFSKQWSFNAINGSLLNFYPVSYRPNVVVIDTGFDFSHEDAGNIMPGSDFVKTPPGSSYIAKTTRDYFNHGTACAGVIGAAANNNIGIAGLFNRCNLYVSCIFSANEKGEAEGSTNVVCAAIYDAVDHYDADVISMSFGDQNYSVAMDQAIQYAYDHDVLLIAAAGNITSANPNNAANFPAALNGVISVANASDATTIDRTSVYNSYVDVAAPGSSICTLYANNNNYAYFNGTSLATPHVAALAAYAKAVYPNITPDEFEAYLRLTSRDILTPGRDNYSGYGMIDCEKLHDYLGVRFYDVPLDEWYTEDIYELAIDGVLQGNGDGCFYPENDITRAEFVTVLANMAGVNLSADQGDEPFSDVNPSHWYYTAVCWGYQQGIAQGNGDGTFAPEASMTREELAAFLVRYMEICENQKLPSPATLTFADRNTISSWAKGDVSVLCQSGIINGFPDNTFRPQTAATRSQAAKMIRQMRDGI